MKTTQRRARSGSVVVWCIARPCGLRAFPRRASLLSLEAGNVVAHAATTDLADGLACRTPDAGALTLWQRGFERSVLVNDRQGG